MASENPCNIVVGFTQNQDLYSILERTGTLGKTGMKFSLYNPKDCDTATKGAQLAVDQLRILRPKIDVKIVEKKKVFQEADVIVIAGLYLPSKSIDQFAAITDSIMSETFKTQELKDNCKIFICGSFRGLVAAKAMADSLDEKHWKNIEVVDPYVFSGIQLFDCEEITDPILYPNKDTIFTTINSNKVGEMDKEKVRLLKRQENGKYRKMEAIEREALGHAMQLYLEESQSLALVGRFPTSDEKDYYSIGDYPVILPKDPKSPIREIIKEDVKKLSDQVSRAFPDEEDDSDDNL